MAEVTGQIGNEYVELDNAATEATLQDLLKAVSAMARTAKVDTKEAQEELENLYKSSRNLNLQQIRERQTRRRVDAQVAQSHKSEAANKSALIESEKEYNKGKQVSRDRLMRFAKAIEQTITVAINITRSFATMGDSMTAAAGTFSNIPLIGGLLSNYLGGIAEAVERLQKGFIEMGQVGATFGGRLNEVSRAAGQAGITIPQFSAIVAKSGQALARMGDSTEDSFRRMTRMSRLMRTEVTNGLANLGFTTEEANQVMMEYTSRLARTGRARNMSDEQLVKASKDYMVNLTAISRLTGASRKELEEQAMARERDESWNNWLSGLDDESEAALRESMAMFDYLGVGDLARDMLVAGAPLSEVTARLSAMSPELGGLFNELSDAAQAGDAERIQQANEAIFHATRQLGDTMRAEGLDRAFGVMAAQGDPAAQAILKVGNAGRALGEDFRGAFAKAREEAELRETEATKAAEAQQKLAQESNEKTQALADRMGDLITAINNMDLIMPAAIAGAVLTALGGAAVGAALLKAVGLAKTGASAASAAMSGLSAKGLVSGAMRFARVAGPIGLAAGALYGASQGIGKAAEYFDLAEGETATFGQKLASGIGGAVEFLSFGIIDGGWVARTHHNIQETLIGGFQAVGGAVRNFFEDPQGTMKGLGDAVHAGFTTARDFVNSAWTGMKESALGEAVANGFNSARDFVSGVWTSATDKMNEWRQGIVDGYENVKNFTSETWNSATDKMNEWRQGIVDGYENVKNFTAETWNSAKEKMNEWGDKLKDGYDTARSFLSNAWNSAKEKASEWGDRLRDGYEDLRNRAQTTVTNVITTARDLAPKVQEALSNTASAAADAVSSGWRKVTSFFSKTPSEVAQDVMDTPIVSTAESLPESTTATAATSTRMTSQKLLESLNTKLDELIRVTNMVHETNERQLTVQRSLSGDLQLAV